ncbi:MAG: phosphopantetheine-binding protein [Kiritimatiellae bacterium]|jgi:acyl carrier protein|nr:phosphopantetheine-binding protein [Kiritimatiellia bacterium]
MKKEKTMTQAEKIEILEDMFEVDPGTIKPEMNMDELPWDSIAMLSLIALVNERFEKRLNGLQLRSFNTIKDVLDVMEQTV